MPANVLHSYVRSVRTMRCLLLIGLVGVLTLQHEVARGFQANPGGRAKFKITKQLFTCYRAKPTTFVEVTLLDQTLIKSVPQQMYIHLGIIEHYDQRSPVVWTKTLNFAAGSATATVAFDHEFYFSESLDGNQIKWIRITTGPGHQSKSIAVGAFSDVFPVSSFNLNNYLFLSSQPPVSTRAHQLVYDVEDAKFRQQLAQFFRKFSIFPPMIVDQSNLLFNPAEMPTLEHLPNTLDRDKSNKIAWNITPEGYCGNIETLVKNGYYFGDIRDISEHWVGLSPFATIFISEKDLRLLCQESPQKAQALADRVAAGGQLVITECTPDFAFRRSLRTLFSRSTDSDASRHPKLRTKFWQLKPESFQYDELALLEALLSDRIQQSSKMIKSNNLRSAEFLDFNHSDRNLTLFREIGKLKVSLVPIESLTSGEVDFASVAWGRGGLVMTTLAPKEFEDLHWHAVEELSQINPNVPFDKLVGFETLQAKSGYLGVPGVGQPPIILFLALVTGFAFAVGPGCLLLLARFRRKNLILLLVPLLSLLVTLILVGYGLLIDRLDYQVCRLSSTYLDQHNQIAVTHSQNAIFSGRRPGPVPIAQSQMLSVSQYHPFASPYHWRFNNWLNINGIDSPTTVSGTTMRARTLHQITTVGVAAHESLFRIELHEESDNDNPTLAAVNQLGFPIELGVVRHKKSIYLVRDCPAGTAMPLTMVSAPEAADALRTYADEILEQCLNSRDLRGKLIRGSLYSNALSDDLLEKMSSNEGQTYSYCLVLNEPLTWLKDGHFFIIARDNPWLQDLNPDPLIKYQIHLIHGSWR